jgi:hypothetical protein
MVCPGRDAGNDRVRYTPVEWYHMPPNAAGVPGDRDALADEREPAGLARARIAARLLDDLVTVPGTNVRLGLDPLLSVVPGGTLVGGLVSLYVVVEAIRCGVGLPTVARMVLNLAIDTAVGAVPIVGPLFDASVRANRRNVRLFERAVARRARRAEFVDINID